MYDLAFMLKDPEAIRNIKSLLEESFLETEAVNGRVIAEKLSKICSSGKISSILYILLNERILKKEKPSAYIQDYIFKLNLNSFDEYFQTEESAADAVMRYNQKIHKLNEDKFSLVATIPSELTESLKKTSQIEPSLISLISKSKTKLWIVNPFFDEFGASQIINSLVGAAKDGVKINILGRDFNEKSNPGMLQASIFIATVFKSEGVLDNLEFRDLFLRSEDGRQKYALHTKMMISDNSAYIGSANLTEHSLRNNFELGVIIEGESISSLIELINEIWNCATKINSLSLMN